MEKRLDPFYQTKYVIDVKKEGKSVGAVYYLPHAEKPIKARLRWRERR